MGSNEKGMRHDNSKILGFGLLALAAVLVMKGKKAPRVAAVTKNMPSIDAEHQKRVNEVFEMLKDRYSFILEENSTSTTSTYHTIKRGKAFIKLRKADHRTPNYNRFNTDKRIFSEIDLVMLTRDQTKDEAFKEATEYIEKLKEIGDKREMPGKSKALVTYIKRMPDLESLA